MSKPLNDAQVDIRLERYESRFAYLRWDKPFTLLVRLAVYRATADEAQRIGNAMIAAYDNLCDAIRHHSDDEIEEAEATLDVLAADAARLVARR